MKTIAGLIFSIAVLLSAGIPEPAASDWELIGKTEAPPANYVYCYIDSESIQRLSDSVIRYWYLLIPVPKAGITPSKEDLKKGMGFRDYREMNCDGKKTRSVRIENEYPAGYVEPVREWENIEPDSLDEKIYDMLCTER